MANGPGGIKRKLCCRNLSGRVQVSNSMNRGLSLYGPDSFKTGCPLGKPGLTPGGEQFVVRYVRQA